MVCFWLRRILDFERFDRCLRRLLEQRICHSIAHEILIMENIVILNIWESIILPWQTIEQSIG